MSKLDLAQRVPAIYRPAEFSDIVRAICGQVNGVSEGRISARYQAQSSVPVSVAAAVGDVIYDSNVTVTNGTARLGWVCNVASQTGATFQEIRVATFSSAPLTSAMVADVALNNTSNYFDGPSVNQGTQGTWLVFGQVVVDYSNATGSSNILAKLWDGTSVIASARVANNNSTVQIYTITLGGLIVSPAGNLRISVKDTQLTTQAIRFNSSGSSKDSIITAIRIA